MKGEFIWPVRVYYEDTDAAGVVYYANYLRFMERARTEWLRALGFGQEQLREQSGVIFAVRRAELDYLKPARLDDELVVECRIARLSGASFTFSQAIKRADEVLCQGQIRVASLNAETLLPARLPSEIKRVAKELLE